MVRSLQVRILNYVSYAYNTNRHTKPNDTRDNDDSDNRTEF